MRHLLHDNVSALGQIRFLLQNLADEAFTHRHPACFNASVGAHLRHVLDHYGSFLHGLPDGSVDYETRQRDPRLETDRTHALATAGELAGELARLLDSPFDLPLRVRLEGSPAASPEAWGGSTARRELEFLLSHTIHHCALMAVCCRLQHLSVPEDFGVAPSTLRHRRSLATAAS